VLNISEDVNQQVLPINNRFMASNSMEVKAARSFDESTVVPTGELEITSKVFVEFLLE